MNLVRPSRPLRRWRVTGLRSRSGVDLAGVRGKGLERGGRARSKRAGSGAGVGGVGGRSAPVGWWPGRVLGFAFSAVYRRRVARACADALALAAALVFATLLRHDGHVEQINPHGLSVLLVATMVAQVVVGGRFGLYSGRWRYGCFEEVWALARTIAVTTGVVLVMDTLLGRQAPRSAIIASGMIALVLTGGVRYGVRLLAERRMRPRSERARRVIVVGAGEGGEQVVRAMLRSPASPYVPMALLDDDPAKRSLRIMGVPVIGTRDDLAEAVRTLRADAVLIAIPSADADLVRALVDLAVPLRVEVKVVPPVGELFGRSVSVEDIRPVTHADLLGRREIRIDLAAVAGYLAGRRVLVTGAGGSIGSELCRQVARFGPSRLVMLDRDESGLHAVQLSLDGRAMLDDRNLVVADIRDQQRLDEVFAEHQPQVVFHAAALKHLPLLEMHPSEALKTNIIGTYQVLETAVRHGVSRLVNISTDKAADPISVLGYSKRIAERLTASANESTGGTFLSVRFGNVLGSRGSVLTAFHAQIEAGGPITVTHPDVTRFFMTVQEAVRLVIQAGAIDGGGEALVLDMGEPVRIADVARRLIATADRPINIAYTGLRPGEKLHEILLGSGEPDHRPNHPLISQVPVPPLDGAVLSLLDPTAPRDELIRVLRWLAQTPALSSAKDKGLAPAGTARQKRSATRQRFVLPRQTVQTSNGGPPTHES
jgi:FlaA1/EpsC-like NDP-sugar epimerase